MLMKMLDFTNKSPQLCPYIPAWCAKSGIARSHADEACANFSKYRQFFRFNFFPMVLNRQLLINYVGK